MGPEGSMAAEGMGWLALLVGWLALLAIGGAIIEGSRYWRSRHWIRRLRGIESGREAQRRG